MTTAIDGQDLGTCDADVQGTEHDIDKREEEPVNTPVQKLHSAFVDGFGRNQQPHDISSERFGEAEHQYSYQQEEHNPLNHYGTYITVASFSIASCNDNL